MARYVLYDFDSDDLATSVVHHSYEEAKDDASGLDNVLILRLPMSDDLETLRQLVERLWDSADDTGCDGDLIVTSKAAVEQLVAFVRDFV
jgi:hypothetical protein